jgi:hypothetical protein
MHRALCNTYTAAHKWTPSTLPHAVAVYSPANFPVFVPSHLTILFTGMLVVVTFVSDKHYGLVDRGVWGI